MLFQNHPDRHSQLKMNELILETIIEALKFIFPAYCANAAPVIFGGGKPIDRGKKFIDGKPIFGVNKTFRGLIYGLIIGTIVGFVEHALFKYPMAFGFITALGALIGDLFESFIKRRLGKKPGEVLPLADQLDFVSGALAFSLLVMPPKIEVFILVLVITPPIHLATNYFAYLLKLKKAPF